MVNVKVERDGKKEGESIIINSRIREELTADEFDEVYHQRVKELDNLMAQINYYKQEAKKLQDLPEETEEVKKIKELMEKASKILKFESAQKELQRLERRREELERDLKIFNRIKKSLL